MDKTNLFSIGEVAKMFRLSLGTLRHYDNLGILKPEYIDPDSGYRYYGTKQFEILNTVRYLRELDMPLSQIKEFLQNRDVDLIVSKLEAQKNEIHQKIAALESIDRKINNRLLSIQRAQGCVLETPEIIKMPACKMVVLKESLKPKTFLDLEESIRRLDEKSKSSLVFLGKVGIGISKERLEKRVFDSYDIVFLALDEEDETGEKTQMFAPCDCANIYFSAHHNKAEERYEKLFSFIEENGFEIDGFSREITLIDNGLTNDESKFVTQIYIPVSRNEK